MIADDNSSVKENPPKPVSSCSSNNSDNDGEGEYAGATQSNRSLSTGTVSTRTSGESCFFIPYRTVGVVSSGAFHLVPHQNSAQAVAACPIGDRFQLLQTDRLHPVLVSQAVTTVTQKENVRGERRIKHIVTDPSLSITVVTHGPSDNLTVDTVTLFRRTLPVSTQKIVQQKGWKIQDMISMGRIQTSILDDPEKEGRQENVAVLAVILSKDYDVDDDDDNVVPVVGDDCDSSYSDDSSASENEEHETMQNACSGQIVILIASRTSLRIQSRVSLNTIPTFFPTTAMHPATYLNKLVLGGSIKGELAACLVNVRSGKVVHIFQCLKGTKRNKGIATTLEQAPAIDTLAMGTNQGTVHLLNLKHDKLLFSLHHKPKDGKGNIAITSISFRTDGSAMHYGIAPMAVGRSDGRITVWDLTPPEDEEMGRTILCEMDRVHPGGVAKVQYFPQEPLLLSTGKSSNSTLMHIFDNPDHSARILRQRKGHMAPPTKIRYLHPGAGAGGGVLANASDGTDASSCQILSSGGPDRTLRVFSTARTVLDKEYSQGQGMEKRARMLGLESRAELLLPPLRAMAMSEARSRDWGDLVTIHQDHSFAYVWSTRRGAQSGPVLRQLDWNISAMKKPPPTQTHATSVAMSACGSFALIGTKNGTIYRYNVQSGIARGSYPRDATDSNDEEKKSRAIGDVNRTTKALEKTLKTSSRSSNLDRKKINSEDLAKREQIIAAKLRLASHNGFAVTGLAVDIVNKTLISVGADAKLILWNFQTHAPHKKSPYKLPCAATKMCHVRDSDLAAVALEDFSIVLFDCSALSIVRRFGKGSAQHKDTISDICFSPDGRSLYTSSLDKTIRVWDVPTNKCVDWLGFKAAPTSLTISPTGEYLATTHAGKLGISIWSDKSYYRTVHVDGADLTEPARMDEPVPIADTSGVTERQLLATSNDSRKLNNDNDGSGNDAKVPVMPKEEGLITLSGLPTAHWKNLFHLELVKQRNKSSEPPKKPPSAPFFLQWRPGEPTEGLGTEGGEKTKEGTAEDDEWAAAWSDDVDDETETAAISKAPNVDLKRAGVSQGSMVAIKRRKVTHYRSHLASLLKACSTSHVADGELRFQRVTDHIASLGPSAIDVALSTLCSGMHDLKEGLPLILLASQWLLEACRSRERFEAVNAYLHRFLYLHSLVITGIQDGAADRNNADKGTPEELDERFQERKDRFLLIESVSQLRLAQLAATEALRGKMEHTLCLLRHFSRMV